ncbi:Uncharacterized protein APZ42_006239, partial [Daphnia magna]
IWAWSPQIPVRSLSCPVRTFNRAIPQVKVRSFSCPQSAVRVRILSWPH